LFEPGNYAVDVPIGYYTQVLGLGSSPQDVVFNGGKGPWCPEGTESVSTGSLNTFWRGAENFHSKADYSWFGNPGMMWAASQAAPVRRVIVENDLLLYTYREGEYDADFASGGYLANAQVKGEVESGSEQQYFFRNSDITFSGGVWNMNFVGVEGAPESHCGNEDGDPIVSIDTTPSMAEKPFISIDSSGKYTLNVPELKTNSRGVDFSTGKQISFEHVFVADASMSASTINAKLSEGLHVVFAAGIYNLEETLKVEHADQVLLGVGIPTLITSNGGPVIEVGNVDGVRIAGMLLEAGSQYSEALLLWGDGSHAGSASNPGILQDVPMRVGGTVSSGRQAQSMLKVNSGNVIGDNLWLWRADHTVGGVGIVDGNNPCKNGAIINGDDVSMYGFMVEHANEDLVQWNGERGSTYMMQSEMPYDVTQAYGESGFVGYRVNDAVQEHDAYGIGIYHFFRDYPVVVESAIKVPDHLVSRFQFPLSVYLNGKGTIRHIINELGEQTSVGVEEDDALPMWYCGDSPGPSPHPSPHPSPRPTPTPSPVPTPPSPTPSPAPSPGGTCAVGENVACPDGASRCQGNQCCGDGSACPSAEKTFSGCELPKSSDCTSSTPAPAPVPAPVPAPPAPAPPAPAPTPTPSPQGTCAVGENVACPGSDRCQGNQCCMDGSACPSAENTFNSCQRPKGSDCTTGLLIA